SCPDDLYLHRLGNGCKETGIRNWFRLTGIRKEDYRKLNPFATLDILHPLRLPARNPDCVAKYDRSFRSFCRNLVPYYHLSNNSPMGFPVQPLGNFIFSNMESVGAISVMV